MVKKKSILLVAATHEELEGFPTNMSGVNVFLTGVGVVNSLYSLQKHLTEHPDYKIVVQAGIAGSYRMDLKPGTVVNVVSECFGDTGLERSEGFQTLFESGFDSAGRFPYDKGRIVNPHSISFPSNLSQVLGLTVAMACGTERTARLRAMKFNADVESMEGASLFYVCKQMGIPFVQLRSVSNFCGPGDHAQWDIPLAVKNLKQTLTSYINRLHHEI